MCQIKVELSNSIKSLSEVSLFEIESVAAKCVANKRCTFYRDCEQCVRADVGVVNVFTPLRTNELLVDLEREISAVVGGMYSDRNADVLMKHGNILLIKVELSNSIKSLSEFSLFEIESVAAKCVANKRRTFYRDCEQCVRADVGVVNVFTPLVGRAQTFRSCFRVKRLVGIYGLYRWPKA
ncbi:hypothetical protein CDAR_518071 [Caerostris darwini]|uniref:Uncharacterized protein n=1 Tax=Caerostris darwini TaxID=1538125 RepID=A0AAV4VHW7_9ARAC|nr:hypothetical protein CDAR_518071 [Caerostris darwini]